MTREANLFCTRETLTQDGWVLRGDVFHRDGMRCLPLLEAKLVHQYNHRAATFAEVPAARRFRLHARARPMDVAEEWAIPRFWVAESAVRAKIGAAQWLCGFRNAISAVADARSLVVTLLPPVAVANSLPLLEVGTPGQLCLLLAIFNSFLLDYILRQKASGSNLNFHVLKQLPVPSPPFFNQPCPWKLEHSLHDWFVPRVVALNGCTEEVLPFVRACGVANPAALSPEARQQVRQEIDAACFYLYGLDVSEAAHVLDTFAIAERRQPQKAAILARFCEWKQTLRS